MYRLSSDKELTPSKLSEFIADWRRDATIRYVPLQNAYKTKYDIFTAPPKPSWKPDNRLAVNFAKYIVDTMNGFFIGIPVKTTGTDEKVVEYVDFIDKYNGQDDNNAELSKICSIYGKGYEMYYVDNDGQIGIVYLSPLEAFMIYDDSVLETPRYFVRLYKNDDGVLHGSVSDERTVRYFTDKNNFKMTDERLHGFNGVPATEYKENEEEIGIFEPVMSLINAYNKAISEKANDVDYFGDAYLKVLGAVLDQEGLANLRANRIINFEGLDSEKVIVDFLQKPDGDTTQENLINRLEKLIFQISMVANISDENFGNSSGIALRYKLLAMSNLAKTKERKFKAGMQNRYKLIFSNPISGMGKDAWVGLDFKFTQNYPANLLEEAQIAAQLSGITSKETQLKVLSVVDDVQSEIERIDSDVDPLAYATDFPTNRTNEKEDAKKPTMYEITSILTKRNNGNLTYNNALRMLVRIGLDEEEARLLLDDKDII